MNSVSTQDVGCIEFFDGHELFQCVSIGAMRNVKVDLDLSNDVLFDTTRGNLYLTVAGR